MCEVVEVSSSEIEVNTLFNREVCVVSQLVSQGWPREPTICCLDRQHARNLPVTVVLIEHMRWDAQTRCSVSSLDHIYVITNPGGWGFGHRYSEIHHSRLLFP